MGAPEFTLRPHVFVPADIFPRMCRVCAQHILSSLHRPAPRGSK